MSWLAVLGDLLSGLGQQGAEHFIYFGAERLPLNTRESGMFLGVALAFLLCTVAARGRCRLPAPPTVQLLLLLVGLAGLLDGVHAVAGGPLYAITQEARLASGLAMGAGAVGLLLPYWNRLVLSHTTADPPFDSVTDLLGSGVMVALLATCLYLLASLTLWPLALGSLAGLGLVALACGGLLLLPLRTALGPAFPYIAALVGLIGTLLWGHFG